MQAQPVLSLLKSGGDAARVTDRDRRIARQVHRELETALLNLLSDEEETVIETVIRRSVVTTGPGGVRVAGVVST